MKPKFNSAYRKTKLNKLKSFVLILVTEKSTFFAVTFFDSNSIIATIHQIFRQSLSFPGTVVQQLVGIFVDEWR